LLKVAENEKANEVSNVESITAALKQLEDEKEKTRLIFIVF